MKLSAPKQVTWLIAVVVGCLGILGTVLSIPVVSQNALGLLMGGFVLLVAATLFKGL